MQIIW